MDQKGLAYWQANLRVIGVILAIWFVVAYLLGIVFAQELNAIKLGGYPLGFFVAQQGSIYVFVALIFWYAKQMNDIDRKFEVHED